MILHECSQGYPIVLDEITQEVLYKNVRVKVEDIMKAHKSGLSKIQLSEKLFFEKKDGLIEFGCLIITESKLNQLIKLSCKQLRTYNKVGN